MSITHTFVSAVPDDADTSLVRPIDWNASHAVSDIDAAVGTITADNPILSGTETWNNGAVTFAALRLNVTDTASAAASLLLDLQIGGVSKFKVQKDGTIHTAGYTAGSVLFSDGSKIAQNNTKLSWSNTNLSLGVGTTAKSNIDLDVEGTGDRDVARFTRYSAADDESPNTQFSIRGARGTSGTPLATLTDDELGAFNFKGHTGAAFTGTMAGFVGVATEDTAPTATGARIEFRVTPNGTTGFIVGVAVDHDGRLYGTALHNNSGAVTGTTKQYVASGKYTPTLFNTTNVGASTPYEAQWIRVGNVVTVSGRVDVDPTAAGAATVLGISLPIASNLAANEDLAGTACADGVASESAAIYADAANNRAQMVWVTTSAANHGMSFTFTYEVL